LASPLVIRRVGGHRRWVILCTIIQAASFVPMVWWAIHGEATSWQVLVATSVYWASGMAAATAWYTWMARLVPKRIRATYFAQRNRVSQACVLVAFVAAATILQAEGNRDKALVGFAILFAVAGAARLASSVCLVACREPRRRAVSKFEGPADLASRIRAAWHALGAGHTGRLIAFLCCFMFGIQVAAPYFTPYMLDELGFSYGNYLLVVGASFFVKAVLLPRVGRIGSRLGPWRLIRHAALAVTPLSLLWLPSDAVWWLVGVQILAGTCWAAYELSLGLLLFEVAGEHERGNLVGLYTLGSAVATVAGAGCGGLLLRWLGEDRWAYSAVFAASAVARLLAIPLLLRLRKVEPLQSMTGQPPG
jgi:hypothetical protein